MKTNFTLQTLIKILNLQLEKYVKITQNTAYISCLYVIQIKLYKISLNDIFG